MAGSFYAGDADGLRREVAGLMPPPGARRPAIGALVPHAGLKYSGKIAAETLAGIEIPVRVLILALNHRMGSAPDFSVWPGGKWRTPLGDVAVEEGLTAALLKAAPGAQADTSGHLREHSAEVQIPILQTLRPGVRIAVVSIGSDSKDDLQAFGRGAAEAVRETAAPVLVLASTDFTHYESQERARSQDAHALEAIGRLDSGGLFEAVRHHGITMCGYGPTTAALECWKALGARRAELVRYGTSGDVTGECDEVVGYAGFRIYGAA